MTTSAVTLASILFVSLVPAVASADLVNGSFENDYEGWTLAETSADSSFGTWGLIARDQTLSQLSRVHDFSDRVDVVQYSSGLPLTGAPTDGAHLSIQLQNGPTSGRMYQNVRIAEGSVLSWDVAYHNWFASFGPGQHLQITLRDTDTDAVLATVFETAAGDAQVLEMTHHTVDLAAYAGMTVRFEIELAAQKDFFDVQLDNIRIAAPRGPDDTTPDPVMDAEDPSLQADLGAEGDAVGGGCSTGGGSAGILVGLGAMLAARRRR